MSDLSYTQAQWTRLMRETGLWLRHLRKAVEDHDRFFKERVQVVNEGDTTSATPHVTAVTLTGVHYGTNTSELGQLYVRFVANGGNWDVSLYTAAGASGLVARATNVAASATGALAAQNSSGLSGTVTLGASIAGDVTDKHRLRVFVDHKLEALKIWPSDGTTDDDTGSRAAFNRYLERERSRALDHVDSVVRGLEEWALGADDNPVGRLNAFLLAAESALINESPRTETSGAVVRIVTGLLERLRLCMQDETDGGEQDIVRRVTAGAAGVFDSGNDGQGSVASHTPQSHCPVGTAYFTCVRGHDTNDGGEESFDGYLAVSGGDERISFTGLRVKQSWKGPRGFGPITLLRSRTKTSDGGNLILAAASAMTETGENDENTDGGVLYVKTEANGGNWDISFYNSTNRADGDLVAKAENIAASAVFQATERNGSGLTVNWTLGGTVSASSAISVDLNFFAVQNANLVPDRFEVAVSLTSTGVAAKLIAERLRARINEDTSGSESIPDSLLALVNTFVPYVAVDN